MSKKKKESYFVHKSAYIDEKVTIGKGTKIWHFSHIMKGSELGKNCTIGQNVFIGEKVTIGNNVKIQNNVSVYTGVILEDGVFCGPAVVFTNVRKPRSLHPVNKNYEKTLIRQGVTIGAHVTIICPLTIGKCAFIGAGSVVTKDVPDFALVYGNPARGRGWICECARIIKFKKKNTYLCRHCQRKYKQTKNKIIEL